MGGPTSSKKGINDIQYEPRRPHELVWFSHLEKELQVVNIGLKKLVQWKEEEPPRMWDWDNCSVNRAKVLTDGKVRMVIRSKTNRNSNYMGRIPVELRFMLGIDIASISEPYSEPYELASSHRKNLPFSAKKASHKRWVCKLDQRYWIWQWAKDGDDIHSSKIYLLYEDIRNFLEEARSREAFNPEPEGGKNGNNIFKVSLDDRLDDIVPIIYQPAIDSLKNFVREVHCAKVAGPDSSLDVEITLLFNNEELRRHKYLDRIYSKIRIAVYGRTRDVETFRIHIVKQKNEKSKQNFTHNNPINDAINEETNNRIEDKSNDIINNKNNSDNYFVFENIYSGQYDIEHDTIHLDKPPAPRRPIEYYFLDHYHPIIFINTANHAMSEHDNNHDIWKWEYIPWVKKAPIKLGFKSRKDIDLRFTPFIKRLFKLA
jgi:hypothetical protein